MAGNLGRLTDDPTLDVIHTVGPIAVGQPTASQAAELRSCYLSSLDLLLEHRLRSVVRVNCGRGSGAGAAGKVPSDQVPMSSCPLFPRLSHASPQACLVSQETQGLAWAGSASSPPQWAWRWVGQGQMWTQQTRS